MAFEGACEIRRVLFNTDTRRVQLDLKATNGEFDWSWFLCKQQANREVLATAIAAMTSPTVKVYVAINNVALFAEITTFGLAK